MGWLRDLSGGDFGTSIAMLIVAAALGFFTYLFTIKKEAADLHFSPLQVQKVNT
jgi:hypothetical protein